MSFLTALVGKGGWLNNTNVRKKKRKGEQKEQIQKH